MLREMFFNMANGFVLHTLLKTQEASMWFLIIILPYDNINMQIFENIKEYIR